MPEMLQDYRGRRIVVIHGSDQDYSKHVVNGALAVGAELVGISEATRLPCGDHPMTVIRSGIDPARIRCEPDAGGKLRRALGVRNEDILIGFSGRLSGEKKLPILIAALIASAPVSVFERSSR